MRTIRLASFTASLLLLLSASCLVASAEEVKSNADDVKSNAADADERVWYQFYCTKCDYKGSKHNCHIKTWEGSFKNKQMECYKCGGLVKAKLVSPPG